MSRRRAQQVELVAITREDATRWVNRVHRHLDYPTGDCFRVGLKVGRKLVAVGVAGRPGRMIQDGRTLELTRIASLAPKKINACSRLYGALIRAGLALGYTRFVTYVLDRERGVSPLAAGFEYDGFTRGGDTTRAKRPRKAVAEPGPKKRFIKPGRDSGLWKDLKPGKRKKPGKTYRAPQYLLQ